MNQKTLDGGVLKIGALATLATYPAAIRILLRKIPGSGAGRALSTDTQGDKTVGGNLCQMPAGCLQDA
jgi:hypothetical protein